MTENRCDSFERNTFSENNTMKLRVQCTLNTAYLRLRNEETIEGEMKCGRKKGRKKENMKNGPGTTEDVKAKIAQFFILQTLNSRKTSSCAMKQNKRETTWFDMQRETNG